jgi:hypothetical protein
VEHTSAGYKCQVIKDEKEESLLAQMCEHIEHLIKDHSSSAPPNKAKISFIEKDYFNNDTSIIALAIASLVNDYGLHIASILPSITLAGSSPPPDFSPLLG